MAVDYFLGIFSYILLFLIYFFASFQFVYIMLLYLNI